MITKLLTATNIGLDTQLIEVEIDLTPSLPMIVIVGLPDKAVQESKERVRSAIKQSGYEFPLGKITVNLAPAGVIKSGSSLDLPIAVGILKLIGAIKNDIGLKSIFLGELSLDGHLRGVTGILSTCLWARRNGYDRVFVPLPNHAEAQLVSGIEVFAVDKLSDIVDFLNAKIKLEPVIPINFQDIQDLDLRANNLNLENPELELNDMAFVKGQTMAKRALEIGASGGHNILFIGQPGSGKTLLAKSYTTILPRMTEEEILEVTQIYSVAGLLDSGKILSKRPFRAPHHSCSHIALVGGSSKLRPGEISLAHRGVLFLDEFPEFSRESIEVLRQPLEDGYVTISRATGSIQYPASFYLLAAANPTPAGFDADDPDGMNKPQNRSAIARYQAKFSGPILDRIDLQVDVNRPTKDELESHTLAEKSSDIRLRIQKARDKQTARFAGTGIFTNSEMSLSMIQKYCVLDKPTQELLSKAVDKFKLSARAYMRLIKLSRTIADLEGSENIQLKHLAESLQYRGRWG
jgi:magnesium chelatase family protein